MKAQKLIIMLFTMLLLICIVNAEEFQPQLTQLSTIANNRSFDHHVLQPNGDILFYQFEFGETTITVQGFKYQKSSHSITQPQQLGSMENLFGLNSARHKRRVFGTKTVLLYAINNGFAVITLEGEIMQSYLAQGLILDNDSNFQNKVQIVSDSALVVLQPEHLVYYKFTENGMQNLLSGEDYECDPYLYQSPLLMVLPDDYFLYVKDVIYNTEAQEIWMLFDSAGNFLQQINIDDEYFKTNLFYGDMKSTKIHGRYYLNFADILGHQRLLEYTLGANLPFSFELIDPPVHILNDAFHGVYPFGEDGIIRYHACYGGTQRLYYDQVPLATGASFGSYYFTAQELFIDPISDELLSVTYKDADTLRVAILYDKDLAEPFYFRFQMSSNAGSQLKTVVYEDMLIVIASNRLYFYEIGLEPVSNDDPFIPALITQLRAYPNPVLRGQKLAVESSNTTALVIYNLKGQKVCELPPAKNQSWDLTDAAGHRVPAGIYFIRQKDLPAAKAQKILILH